MKLKKLDKNLLLFTFDTRKEITTTFFRVQEYYESPNLNLHRKKFSVFQFLQEQMCDDGHIDYFSFWSGFNIPGHIINSWWKDGAELDSTTKEEELMTQIWHNVDMSDRYYVIGAEEKDLTTINHEIAHALYYLNRVYTHKMGDLIQEFMTKYKEDYDSMVGELLRMGYNEDVIDDEIQAYLSSEKKKDLEDFGINFDYKRCYPIIKKFRSVLKEFNTYKIQ
jgi:hypothetical protein